ncbi:MAG: LysR family transcriptional regulator [Clostridia bacterium]|nr:LysR family transcriptional regulator [Clostridia bacterium]
MPSLELYRIFKIVAEEGNLTRASELLFISQPAVTKHIHNLENELNLKLFERTQHGMVLTKDGEKLYNQIKDSVNVLSSVKDNVDQITNINLGIHINFSNDFYRPLLNKLKEKNPEIEFTIGKSNTENMFSMLEKNEVDAYLSKRQPEDIHNKSIKFISLGTLHDNFFVNSNSKYLNKSFSKDDSATIYTLRNISSTSKNIEKAIKENGFENITIKNNTFNTILEELEGNDIIAYITEEYIQKELNEGKFKRIDLGLDIQNEVEYGIYYNATNKLKNVKKIFENI